MKNRLGEIKVVNKRWFKGEGVYIGRGSRVGNRWVVKKKKSKYEVFECENIMEVLENYERWLRENIKNKEGYICSFLNEVWKKVKRGEEVNLICYCKKRDGSGKCHGEVIKKIIEEKL